MLSTTRNMKAARTFFRWAQSVAACISIQCPNIWNASCHACACRPNRRARPVYIENHASGHSTNFRLKKVIDNLPP